MSETKEQIDPAHLLREMEMAPTDHPVMAFYDDGNEVRAGNVYWCDTGCWRLDANDEVVPGVLLGWLNLPLPTNAVVAATDYLCAMKHGGRPI